MITTRSRPVRILAVVLGGYLVARGAAEFFVVDVHDPSTYRHDWGGPSLVGVLAVHVGPGVLVAGWCAHRLATRKRAAR